MFYSMYMNRAFGAWHALFTCNKLPVPVRLMMVRTFVYSAATYSNIYCYCIAIYYIIITPHNRTCKASDASWPGGLASELVQELHRWLSDTSVGIHGEGNKGVVVRLHSGTCGPLLVILPMRQRPRGS
jgi:hypothetical protein